MMNERKSVDLQIAFEWTCCECGVRQFVRGFAPEFDVKTAEMLTEIMGKDNFRSLRRHPANVKCCKCGNRFKAEL